MQRIILAAVTGLASGLALAQAAPSVSVVGDETLLTLSARGVQIYECRPGASGAPEWTFKAPRADLFADGRQVGRHFAGPSWELQDGSRIVGKVVASAPAPEPGNIPWLRLSVASTSGQGALNAAKAVQRINTQGGVLSGACPTEGAVSEVPYTADYLMLRGSNG